MSDSDSGGTSGEGAPGTAGLRQVRTSGPAGHHEWAGSNDPDGWVTTSSAPGRRSQGGRSYQAPHVIPEREISVSGSAVISVVMATVADLMSILLAVVVLGRDDTSRWSLTEGWKITHGWLSVILAAAMLSVAAGAMVVGRRALRQISAARGRKRGTALVRTAYALALLAIIGGLVVLGAYLMDNPPELPEW